jgi:ABC-type glucose/galactose transport system permease subunit
MSDFVQFFWTMSDSVRAALVGLNLLPVLIFGLFLGMIQPRRSPAWLFAGLAVIPAVIVTALLPTAMGYQAIWPDLTQLEVEFQMIILFVFSYIVIRATGLIKATLMMIAPKPSSQKPV